MNFDTKFPEFKQALGLSFAELQEDTKTALLAEWASRGDFDKLKASLTEIDVLKPLKALNGESFSRWMLTHENDEMFDCWKELVNNHGVKMEGNAGVLSILMNKPERLKFLPKEEMNACLLPKVDKPFHSNIFSSEEVQKKLELIYDGSSKFITPIAAALVMGLPDLALDLAKSANREKSYDGTRLLIGQIGGKMPVEKMVELVNTIDMWATDGSHYQRKHLFNAMVRNWDLSALETLFKLVPEEIKLFEERLYADGALDVFETLLKRGQLEKIDFLIEKGVLNKDLLRVHHSELNGLLEKKREHSLIWLEENSFGLSLFKDYKDWIINKSKSKKQGNALTYALRYGMDELAKVLMKKGMTLENAVVIDNHPFAKDEPWYPEFSSRLQKFRLNEKVQTIGIQEKKEIKRKAL